MPKSGVSLSYLGEICLDLNGGANLQVTSDFGFAAKRKIKSYRQACEWSFNKEPT